MADTKQQEPKGFGDHTRGVVGEAAHEQGWGLNQDERTKLPEGEQNTYGGTDYDYGARDFGDEPINMGRDTSQDSSNVANVAKEEGR